MIISLLIVSIIYLLSILLIYKYGTRSIVYLPVFFITYEILKNIFIEFGIETGFNGFQNLNTFLFIIPHLKKIFRSGTLGILVLIFLIYYITRIPYAQDVISLSTQTLGLFNIYILLLIGYSFNIIKHHQVFQKLNSSFYILLIIYCVYLIIASLLSFGPNHYNTGLIYGLRFEQYYSASFVIVLYPLLREYLSANKVLIFQIFILIGVMLIVLTLRRTSIIIVIMGIFLFPLFYDLNYMLKFLKKYTTLIVVFLSLFFITISLYTDIYSIRSDEFSTSYDIESEGRFIEFNLVSFTLEKEDSWLWGIRQFLNEEGNYNFPNDERALHGTLSKLLLGGGLIGVSLYYMIFIYIGLSVILNNNYRKRPYRAMILTLLVIYLVVALTGAIGVGTGVSFTGSIFLYIGFLFNIIKNKRLSDV